MGFGSRSTSGQLVSLAKGPWSGTGAPSSFELPQPPACGTVYDLYTKKGFGRPSGLKAACVHGSRLLPPLGLGLGLRVPAPAAQLPYISPISPLYLPYISRLLQPRSHRIA